MNDSLDDPGMLFLFVLENMSYFTPLRIEQVKGGCYAADRVRWPQRSGGDKEDVHAEKSRTSDPQP